MPAVAFGLQPHHRFAVLELGMSLRGEIAALSGIAEPDVAMLTNVGIAHAEGVGGTRADVAREKGALFASLSKAAVAVASFDDAAAQGQLARTRAGLALTFGAGDEADYRLVERREAGPGGARLRIVAAGKATDARAWLPLLGEAAAIDFVAALAAAESAVGPLGDEVISGALAQSRFKRGAGAGRMQVRHLADGTLVLDDTYNANPASMRAALHTLGELAKSRGARVVVILGEMRELGPTGPAEHEALAEAIVQAGAALALICGGLADLPSGRRSAEASRSAAPRGADAAALLAVERVGAGDVVLVKASRSVGAERVVEALSSRAAARSKRPPPPQRRPRCSTSSSSRSGTTPPGSAGSTSSATCRSAPSRRP